MRFACPRFPAINRLSRPLRLLCLALVLPAVSGQAPPTPTGTEAQAAMPIVFPYKNISDLRGLLNVFVTFRRACLDQKVTADLAETLVPDGYRVVSLDEHWDTEKSMFPEITVLSKTGLEESDFAGGHPFIELKPPSDSKPEGGCRVVWKRAWDYSEKIGDIMLALAAPFDSQISYYLQAIRASRPDVSFKSADNYPIHANWLTQCMGGKTCAFTVMGSLKLDSGIDLTITRDEVREVRR